MVKCNILIIRFNLRWNSTSSCFGGNPLNHLKHKKNTNNVKEKVKRGRSPLESGLAEGDNRSAGLTHPLSDGQRLLLKSLFWYHLTDQTVQQSIMGWDGGSCEQHLHGNLVKKKEAKVFIN